MKFTEISSEQAITFLLPRHYSGRKPNISIAFGWFDNDELKAVCTFGKPASFLQKVLGDFIRELHVDLLHSSRCSDVGRMLT